VETIGSVNKQKDVRVEKRNEHMMTIGVVKEIKTAETRVGLVPSGAAALREAGHRVLVESGAGAGSLITDDEYRQTGALVVETAEEVWLRAELVVKVKEPQPEEFRYFRPGLILFAYLHLAPLPELTEMLIKKKITAIAYETVCEADGSLPMLIPMSEVAGRMAVQVGATLLQYSNGGRGVLLGGVPGVQPGNVVILGGGVVGYNAAISATGLGANVTILDKNLNRLRQLEDSFRGRVKTLWSNAWTVAESLKTADLVVGGVLIPGAYAPKLVSRQMLAGMKRGAVMVDVSIDQGGCFETSHPTTHTDPVYFVDGILHYCVTNMPAAVPQTSTAALTNATAPYLLELATFGVEGACERRPSLREGINTHNGKVVHPAVAEALKQVATVC
jgi:alanine dehydrogenase